MGKHTGAIDQYGPQVAERLKEGYKLQAVADEFKISMATVTYCARANRLSRQWVTRDEYNEILENRRKAKQP